MPAPSNVQHEASINEQESIGYVHENHWQAWTTKKKPPLVPRQEESPLSSLSRCDLPWHGKSRTFLHNAHDEDLVLDSSVRAGIRAPLTQQKADMRNDRRCGFDTITARELDTKGAQSIVDKIRQRIGEATSTSVSISMPSTLHLLQLTTILAGLEGLNIIGGDVVEVAPAYDDNGETPFEQREHLDDASMPSTLCPSGLDDPSVGGDAIFSSFYVLLSPPSTQYVFKQAAVLILELPDEVVAAEPSTPRPKSSTGSQAARNSGEGALALRSGTPRQHIQTAKAFLLTAAIQQFLTRPRHPKPNTRLSFPDLSCVLTKMALTTRREPSSMCSFYRHDSRGSYLRTEEPINLGDLMCTWYTELSPRMGVWRDQLPRASHIFRHTSLRPSPVSDYPRISRGKGILQRGPKAKGRSTSI
ncbi:hypothetical protein TrVFT333_002116 [Trichoderma virens FT-333]|nr:hypothetical protein TrVFT333_002116 [Trichoderma virens FT-333]